jgi:CheY-like chemotaxis protein
MKKLECILLVDDNQHTNFFNKRLINKLGLAEQVIVAENGREGIDLLTGQSTPGSQAGYPRPNLILLDINMPVMDGWDFMKEYAGLPPNQKEGVSAVVMLSTSYSPHDLEKAGSIPDINEFMQKPLSESQLEDIFEKYFPE